METYMEMLTGRAKAASAEAAKLGTEDKNRGLLSVAEELTAQQDMILAENEKDLEAAREKGIKQSLIDRLALSEKRIADMAEGLGRSRRWMIRWASALYEDKRRTGSGSARSGSRWALWALFTNPGPNVTADAFGLCFKTGNAAIPARRKRCDPF